MISIQSVRHTCILSVVLSRVFEAECLSLLTNRSVLAFGTSLLSVRPLFSSELLLLLSGLDLSITMPSNAKTTITKDDETLDQTLQRAQDDSHHGQRTPHIRLLASFPLCGTIHFPDSLLAPSFCPVGHQPTPFHPIRRSFCAGGCGSLRTPIGGQRALRQLVYPSRCQGRQRILQEHGRSYRAVGF